VVYPVRVRFAPSPARAFDIDSARLALANWTFALRNQGRFVLRIEDVVAARRRVAPERVEEVIRVLALLGVRGDDPAFEGPYFQSCNSARHLAAMERLRDERSAYYCACDPAKARCGGGCEERGLNARRAGTLRFRAPHDFPLATADGGVLFVLANTVDDITEGITHVIRGQEHLADSGKQRLLWEALGAPAPDWTHLTPVCATWRTGRPGHLVTVEDFVADGCLPQALADCLASLDATARLEERRLGEFNRARIRALESDEFAALCRPWLVPPRAPWPSHAFDEKRFAAVAPLVQSRIGFLSEVPALVDWLFLAEPSVEDKAWAQVMRPGVFGLLSGILEALLVADWSVLGVAAALAETAHAHGLAAADTEAVVRVAVTGRAEGLPLSASLAVLGRRKTVTRISAALERLAADNRHVLQSGENQRYSHNVRRAVR